MNETFPNERLRRDHGRRLLPPPLLDVDRAREGDDEVIVARGEIDISTVTVLSQAVGAAVRGDAERLVVDLSAVELMDSTGLHVLLDGLRRLTRQGRRLSVVCRQHGQVHRMLSLADLAGSFSVHSTRVAGPGNWRARQTVIWTTPTCECTLDTVHDRTQP